MSFKNSAFICFLLIAHFAGGTAFHLNDDAGKKRLVLADSSSSQRPVTGSPTKKLDSAPEVDWENPPAKGIILKFRRWPDEGEKAVILEKTTAVGLKMIGELPLFKVWIFEWAEWQQTTTAQKVCNSLPTLSSLEYCEPDSLQRPATGSRK